MSLLLHATYRKQSTQLTILPGQVARVGRSTWMDLCLPEDELLEEEHFRIDCVGAPRAISMDGAHLRTAGEMVGTLELHSGIAFEAGESRFQVSLRSSRFDSSSRIVESKSAKSSEVQLHCRTPVRAERNLVNLSERAEIFLAGRESNDLFETAFAMSKAKLSMDALKMMCVSFPHEMLIALAEHCGRLNGDENTCHSCSEDLLADVRRWMATPKEKQRTVVGEWTDQCKKQSTDYWLALAVAWTGGSLVGESENPVAPPKHLPAVAVSVYFQLLSLEKPWPLLVEQAVEFLKEHAPSETKEE